MGAGQNRVQSFLHCRDRWTEGRSLHALAGQETMHRSGCKEASDVVMSLFLIDKGHRTQKSAFFYFGISEV